MFLEKETVRQIQTPAFVFDKEVFAERVHWVKRVLGPEIPLCFSIKSNPFLLDALTEDLDMVEVCSPGELTICQRLHIAPEHIIYSGVLKEQEDVERAIAYGAGILTAESRSHVEIENTAALAQGCVKKVILRLSSGNQFGMAEEELLDIVSHREQYPGLEFMGVHYYSGTQKKKRAVERDLKHLASMVDKLQEQCGFTCQIVEYGPGLLVNYFNAPYEEADHAIMEEAGELLREFAQTYPLSIEMGRFLAATCGIYLTEVKDIKTTDEVNYLICDGGIHHLKYHGQNMAMQIPPMEVVKKEGAEQTEATEPYSVCGSLCTVADVLVREVTLPQLCVGDRLLFGHAGAYTVSEGSVLFLSRTMPRVYMHTKENGLVCVREFIPSDRFHVPDEVNRRV